MEASGKRILKLTPINIVLPTPNPMAGVHTFSLLTSASFVQTPFTCCAPMLVTMCVSVCAHVCGAMPQFNAPCRPPCVLLRVANSKRHLGDSNPCGQSPMDFESISLAARTKCHVFGCAGRHRHCQWRAAFEQCRAQGGGGQRRDKARILPSDWGQLKGSWRSGIASASRRGGGGRSREALNPM